MPPFNRHALQYLHKIGLAHKDVKPANVLFKDRVTYDMPHRNIHVKLADFGLARFTVDDGIDAATAKHHRSATLTKHGSALSRHLLRAEDFVYQPSEGTLEYMPPEAIRAEERRFVKLKVGAYERTHGRRKTVAVTPVGKKLLGEDAMPAAPPTLNLSIGKGKKKKQIPRSASTNSPHSHMPPAEVLVARYPFKWDSYVFHCVGVGVGHRSLNVTCVTVLH